MAERQPFLQTAKRVIRAEAAALDALQASLDKNLTQAIELLLNATGRVIVSGMGKSGHIARKIAATFASTGTPAHFVHPAEASHGDLGMLAPGDVVLVLSNSGETPELRDIIAYTRRFQIPLIGVASKAKSSLILQSDIGLVLPEAAEACGTGIVPTSSTTMTLALGDALAIALMEHHNFTPARFHDFHPGGKLGTHLITVGDLMHRGAAIPLVQGVSMMTEVLLEISQKAFGIVGVLGDHSELVGIITDGDLRRHMSGLLALRATEVMTGNPTTIRPKALAEEAVAVMNTRKITCLFVTDQVREQTPIGVLHIHDCLRAGLR
jgi:arabinose-5-phosphate isomerase